MTESLVALSKLNAAHASPANGISSPPSSHPQSGVLPSIDHTGRIMGPRGDANISGGGFDLVVKNDFGALGMMVPISPESGGNSSSDWN